jgi:cytochrome b subunit of formate dehydrogenase
VAVEASGSGFLNRHPRRVRLFHAAVYLTALPLLLTGWWLLLGGEGNPSPLARLFGTGDTRVHVWFGRALLVVALVPLVAGRKGIVTFVRETLRVDRGDGRWWARWPAGSLTGRFGRHEGRFDPGQRLANVVIVGGLMVLTGTGIALTLLHGGPVFAQLARIHKWTTYVVTPFILGHMLIAFSVLPGYRGVWRSMHLGGRVREATARRVWPGWAERSLRDGASNDTADRPSDAAEGRRA